MDLYKLAAMHVKAIVDLLNQHGPTDKKFWTRIIARNTTSSTRLPENFRMMITSGGCG